MLSDSILDLENCPNLKTQVKVYVFFSAPKPHWRRRRRQRRRQHERGKVIFSRTVLCIWKTFGKKFKIFTIKGVPYGQKVTLSSKKDLKKKNQKKNLKDWT